MKERKPRPMNSGDPHLHKSSQSRQTEGRAKDKDVQQRLGSVDGWAQCENARLGTILTIIGSSTPVCHSGFADQGSSDEKNDRTGDHGRENALKYAYGHESHGHFEEGADHGRA